MENIFIDTLILDSTYDYILTSKTTKTKYFIDTSELINVMRKGQVIRGEIKGKFELRKNGHGVERIKFIGDAWSELAEVIGKDRLELYNNEYMIDVFYEKENEIHLHFYHTDNKGDIITVASIIYYTDTKKFMYEREEIYANSIEEFRPIVLEKYEIHL